MQTEKKLEVFESFFDGKSINSVDKTKTVLNSTTYLWNSWVRALTTGRPLSAVSNDWPGLIWDTMVEASMLETGGGVEWVAKSFVNVVKNL